MAHTIETDHAGKIVEQLKYRLPGQGVVNQTGLLLEATRDWLLQKAPGAKPFIQKLFMAVFRNLPMVPLIKAVNDISATVDHHIDGWNTVEDIALADALEQARKRLNSRIETASEHINRWGDQYKRLVVVGGLDAECEAALRSETRNQYEALVIEPFGLDDQGKSQLRRSLADMPGTRLLPVDGISAALQWAEALLLPNAITSAGQIYGNPGMSPAVEMAFPRVRDVALLRLDIRTLIPADRFTFRINDIFTSIAPERMVRTFLGDIDAPLA